ncbi:MAG: hypothetical protein JRG92_12840, partial [Deltaproteobacteria bacterium]|nr:hypothetical protein [Deltaproteobacteria bacterium]
GRDALEDVDRLLLGVARLTRERVIGQNAYDPRDASSSIPKTHALASLVARLHEVGRAALDAGVALSAIDLPGAGRAITSVRDSEPETLETRAADAARVIEGIAGAAEVAS